MLIDKTKVENLRWLHELLDIYSLILIAQNGDQNHADVQEIYGYITDIKKQIACG